MNVIHCYAPTNDGEDQVKDQFYHRLQTVIDNFPERDVTILMGDFNAKIGNDNIGYQEVMGQHWLGVMNDNGERLADLCALNKLVLGVSVVAHRRIHKATLRPNVEKLLRHYGVPVKIVNVIRSSYEGLPCSVIHRGQPTEAFNVRTGVRQGCLLSPFLFLIAIDWITRTAIAQARNGIQWTLWLQLGDLDFAEDLALLSHTHRQMQEKTNSV